MTSELNECLLKFDHILFVGGSSVYKVHWAGLQKVSYKSHCACYPTLLVLVLAYLVVANFCYSSYTCCQ